MNFFARYGIIRTSCKEKMLPNFNNPRYYIDGDNDIYRLQKGSNGIVSRSICKWGGYPVFLRWDNRGYIVNYQDYTEFLENHKRIRKDQIQKHVDKIRMMEELQR